MSAGTEEGRSSGQGERSLCVLPPSPPTFEADGRKLGKTTSSSQSEVMNRFMLMLVDGFKLTKMFLDWKCPSEVPFL